ncbi:MAG TPA: plastocyanin/azurin family copper-binding protein [Longimicrobium sp.]|nr:plastocyanin/azurin family copper-binding protein [Longimicrobium sp.]
MPRVHPVLALSAALLFLGGCSDSLASGGTIEIEDNCEPASFNAALGAGACLHASSGAGQTLASFNTELNATHHVADWYIDPEEMSVREGATFSVTNAGGETHTYTEVEEFGGGVVPALNTASGNTTVAPECADQSTFNGSVIASGQTRQHTFDERGTEKYQCCIHPWMRQVVTVR